MGNTKELGRLTVAVHLTAVAKFDIDLKRQKLTKKKVKTRKKNATISVEVLEP